IGGPLSLLVGGMHGHDDGPGLAAEFGDRVDAVASWHLDVDDRHLRRLGVQSRSEGWTGVDHTDHTGVGETVESLTEPFGEELVVIGNHHSNHLDPHSTVTAVPTPGFDSNLMMAPIL